MISRLSLLQLFWLHIESLCLNRFKCETPSAIIFVFWLEIITISEELNHLAYKASMCRFLNCTWIIFHKRNAVPSCPLPYTLSVCCKFYIQVGIFCSIFCLKQFLLLLCCPTLPHSFFVVISRNLMYVIGEVPALHFSECDRCYCVRNAVYIAGWTTLKSNLIGYCTI